MPPADKKEEESGILANEEQTNNKTALMYKIIFLLIILGLLVIGYLLAIKTNLDENFSDLELIEQQTESPIDLELQNQEQPSEESGLTKSVFPVGYNGFIISGSEVNFNKDDYELFRKEPINRQFRHSELQNYFIANGQVYYRIKFSTSTVTARLLEGVDASSFGMMFPVLPHPYPYIYVKDKAGVICKDRRADHIDKDSFDLFKVSGQSGFTYIYGYDKNNIIVDCLILHDIDIKTFKIIKPDLVQDKNGMYYVDRINGTVDRIKDIDVNSYEILWGGYLNQRIPRILIADTNQVFNGTSSVGKVIKSIPTDFSGELFLKEIYGQPMSPFRILLQHDSGEIDALAEISVDKSWDLYFSRNKFFVYNDKVFFIDGRGILSALDSYGIEEVVDINLDKIDGIMGINDLYLYNDVLFYLKGKNCNTHLARCDLSLYSYNFLDKTERLLATGVKVRSIIGYDEDLNKLYLSYGDGDAGHSFVYYYEYDFNQATLNKIGEKRVSETAYGERIGISPVTLSEILPKLEKMKNNTLVKEVVFKDGKIISIKD